MSHQEYTKKIMTEMLNTSKDRKLLAGPSPRGLSANGLAPSGAVVSTTASVKKIHTRAKTISPFLRELLEFRPPSHWGLNE